MLVDWACARLPNSDSFLSTNPADLKPLSLSLSLSRCLLSSSAGRSPHPISIGRRRRQPYATAPVAVSPEPAFTGRLYRPRWWPQFPALPRHRPCLPWEGRSKWTKELKWKSHLEKQ
ncbi:hypothetical protein ACQJBY_058613 [Aegilops geniculata]